MAKTGEVCTVSGIYKCSEHVHEIIMREGNKFPPCDKHGAKPHAATWILVRKAHH